MPTQITRNCGLFIACDPVPNINLSIPLIIDGTTNKGQFAGIPLFIYSSQTGDVASINMPFYIAANSPQPINTSMPLYLNGQYGLSPANISLFINDNGAINNTTLFIAGQGTTDGAVPFNSSMNLFLRKTPSDGISLYIAGPGTPINNQASFFIIGAGPINLSCSLGLYQVVGPSKNNAPLIINGW